MAKRPRETFHLTEDGISRLRSTVPFSNMTDQSQEMLDEFLQTALGGMNRVEKKILISRLEKARAILSIDEQFALWPQVKAEIEKVLSRETPPPLP